MTSSLPLPGCGIEYDHVKSRDITKIGTKDYFHRKNYICGKDGFCPRCQGKAEDYKLGKAEADKECWGKIREALDNFIKVYHSSLLRTFKGLKDCGAYTKASVAFLRDEKSLRRLLLGDEIKGDGNRG